jgi:hypothetical protein
MILHGRTLQKYAQKVLDKIFTREELMNTVFVEENYEVNSDRTRLQIIKSKSV